MRPSYDAEHPSSATPIYDSLYSEYRRLFRALPGDRSGEENMRFTGFAVREPYYAQREPEALAYPQHQAFHTTFAGQTGTPQFMPAQQQTGAGQTSGGQTSGGQTNSAGSNGGWVAAGYLGGPTAAGSSTTGSTGSASTAAAAAGTGGRHRSMLSLPPGRSSE